MAQNEKDLIKIRALMVKGRLPKNYCRAIIKKFPEYDNLDGLTHIRNVLSGKTTDLELTEKLEKSFK